MIYKIVVIGSGGLAREFSAYFSECSNMINIIAFYSTNILEHEIYSLPGKLFDGEVDPGIVGTNKAVIAIGSPSVKKRVAEELKGKGFEFPSLIHPSSVVSERVCISEGVIVSPNCTISPNVQLESFCYINFGVGVGHDAKVGSYVQVNPGSQIGGYSEIGEETLVGSSSTILQGITIGKNVTVSSGSVVFSKVADGHTVMGNPAKRIRLLEEE